jgi:deoxyribonuclease-4
MASTVAELGDYLDAAGDDPGLGVCLDTCHLHAAGHDLATPGGMRATLTAVRRVLGGPKRLGLVHANDSRDACGSKRDRHEPVGRGTIGLDAFGELFRHPLTRTVPVVIETPGGVAEHRRDLALLEGLRRQ